MGIRTTLYRSDSASPWIIIYLCSVMMTIEIGKHTVEYYGEIEEMPVVRYHKWQKAMLIEAGLGSDIASFDRHCERLRIYIATGDKDNAQKELDNLRQSVWLIQQEVSPRLLAFAALVTKIDGRECCDLSDDALKKVVEQLSDAPAVKLSEVIGQLKKKIEDDLCLFFPKLFDSSETKEYFGLLRNRTIEVLKKIQGKDASPGKYEEQLAVYSSPQVFTGTEGVEVRMTKQFESTCATLSEVLHLDAKRLTVLEFYNAFELLDERARENRQKRAK